MAYIGKTPITGNFVKLDAISVVNGQAAYTMNNGGSAFTNYNNVNQFLVSLNGILQSPTTSFSVASSTITFASNLSTGDVIDFIIVLGNTLDVGVPSDNTVTNAKTNFVSTSSAAGLQIKGDGTTDGTLQLNCSQNSHGIKLKSPAHSAGQSYTLTFPTTAPSADKALITDGSGNLSFGDAGGGKVLQVVNATDTTERTTTSTSYVAASNTLSVNITPSATSSKVLILVSTIIHNNSNGNTYYTIYRDSSNVTSNSSNNELSRVYGHGGNAFIGMHMSFLDSPNTTSQVTYQVRMKVNSDIGYLNLNGGTGSITVMEIGA